MVLAARFNVRVSTLAVSPAMGAASTTDEDARSIRARGLSTIAASIRAFAIAQFAPVLAPAAMATLGLWRRVFLRASVGARASTAGA